MEVLIGFLYYAVRMGTPLLFATTGEILSERAGNLNLGVEGMMAVGAICGYCMGCFTNSLIVAILASFLAAALCAGIYAVLTVTLQTNQTVTGLALTIFGSGIYLFIGRMLTNNGVFPSLSDASRLQFLVSDNGIPLLRDIPSVDNSLFILARKLILESK